MIVGLFCLVVYFGLSRVSSWAESTTDTFPYLTGEDSMRYLLPSLMRHPERDVILLAGSSSAGEGLLYEQFNSAFPAEYTYPGAVSTGTLDDILVLLDYIEKVYGDLAMPKTLVLGISLRFIANYPRRFGPEKEKSPFSPVFNAIWKYSTYYVQSTSTGSKLKSKSWIDGISCKIKFMLRKQLPRYRAAVAAALDTSLERFGWEKASVDELPGMENVRNIFNKTDIPKWYSFSKKSGFVPLLRAWLSIYRSPYQTQYMEPVDSKRLSEELEKENHFWSKVYLWDPQKEEVMVRSQIADLLLLVKKHDIALYVINLPENIISRRLYRGDNYSNYLELVKNSLNGIPFLNLWEMLGDDEFFDEEHPTLTGARRVTGKVIDFIREHRKHGTKNM
ncbi:MAG: hypothetical protein MRK02_03480 [Candidatus Scalindua sp.]|nr:hypothetical protein [Candidatus Scalindua sp.]